MKYLIVFFLCLNCTTGLALQSVVNGKVPALANSYISLYKYTDFFSENKVSIGSKVLLEDDGSFDIKFENNTLTFISGIINGMQFDLYVMPQKVYTIYIDSITKPKNNLLFTTTTYFNYHVKCKDTADINKLISNYEFLSDDFYSKNFKKIINKQARKEFEAFDQFCLKKFKIYNNVYLINHITYNNYLLHNICVPASKKRVQKQTSYTCELSNRALVDYVNENYFNYLTKDITLQVDITNSIETEEDFKKLIRILKKDTLIQNDTLLQIIAINELYKNLYKNNFNKKSLYTTLQHASNNALNEELKLIAENLCIKYKRGSVGQKIDLKSNFLNEQNDTITLEKYNNKNLCLIIGAAGNLDLWSELKLIPRYQKIFGNKFHFICLSVDNNYKKMIQLKNKYKYDFDFLDASSNLNFLEELNLKTIPSFYIISYNGILIEPSGNKPSTLLESKLIQVQ